MIHHPLCPVTQIPGTVAFCACIALETAERDALDAAVQRVEAIPQIEWALNPYPAVIAAIKGGSDE